MKAIYSSETSVDFQLTTRRYIPDDRPLHNHSCEHLRSYNAFICLVVLGMYHDYELRKRSEEYENIETNGCSSLFERNEDTPVVDRMAGSDKWVDARLNRR
jgi:hypothetical protein